MRGHVLEPAPARQQPPAAEIDRRDARAAADRGGAGRALDAELLGARPSVEQRLALPRAWLAHRRPDAALASLDAIERAVAGDPRARVPVRMERARAELARGRPADALGALDAVLASARGGLRVEALELACEAHRLAGTLDDLVASLSREASADSRALLARIEDERGHDEAAIAAYERAIRARPRDAALRERRAHVLLRTGRVEEAARALEALWRSAPDEPDRLVEAATVLVDAGEAEQARALLAAASAGRPRDVRLHRRLAEVFARWGDDARALAEARLLTQLEPREPEHHALVGDLLLARGDRSGALEAFRRMTSGDASATAHARLGAVLADHDLLDEARAELAEALRLAPDERASVQQMIDVLVRSGRDSDAEPLATRLITLSEADPVLAREARAGLVSMWARRRTIDRHVAELEAAFASASPDPEAGALLAEALRRTGALERAAAVLQRLAELVPSDAQTWTTLERVRTLRGDLPGAIDALEHAAAADPSRAASYFGRMSDAALALYRDEDAVRYAERAIALAPNDAHGHVRLGDLHRRRQRLDAAMASYRRALALDPDLHEVALTLADLTRSGGDPTGADALYAHVIEASPDDDLVARAIDASLEIELASGSAEPLLDRLVALGVAHYERAALARAALAVLDAIATPLLPRAETDERALGDLGRIAARALGVLLRALASSDPSEQRTALAILASARVPSAAGALLTASRVHGDSALGLDALAAAAQVVTLDHAARLLEIARGPDVPRALIATWALARLGDAPALATLVAPDSDVAALAVLGLAHAGDTSAATALARSGLASGSASRRAALTLALSALGRPTSEGTCLALTEAGGQARAVALLACGDDDGISRALLSDRDASSAVRAATRRPAALARSWPELRPGEAPVGLGLRAIDRSEPLVPSSALALAIARAVQEGLASAGPTPTLRALGVRDGRLALRSLEGPAATAVFSETADAIVDALPTQAGDPAARAIAAGLLAAVRPADPRLDALLGDTDPGVVRAALEGLRGSGADARHQVDRLAAILAGSPDWVARLAAARVLALAPEGGETALIAALAGDDFAFVRAAAADALGARETGPGADALRAASAGDPEERVRAAASEALARRLR